MTKLNRSGSKPSDIAVSLVKAKKLKKFRSFVETNGDQETEEDENSLEYNKAFNQKYTIDNNLPEFDMKQR